MPSRRPYDEVKSMIALILGLPLLVALVWLLLGYTNLVWGEFGIGAAALFLLAGVVVLAGLTLKSYSLLQEAGGR
ncbi:hypothetical protein [Halorarius litoreus]|uniref:hypothetical protein n=1 Tax=Halorarius litoreus TaxID=2962676 RepID=UPI0020CE7D7D|nr:hypothetical protein [Halorarius litoreus]